MLALAAITLRSAEAMSGRRSSSCDGRLTGICGKAGMLLLSARANSAGALPSSTAMAFSNCARCQTRSIRSAWVVLSWVRAWATASGPETPARYWFSVMRNERSYVATVASSRRFCSSITRNCR
ncbi:hypothetical protein D3C79_768880 [compost metagenome]